MGTHILPHNPNWCAALARVSLGIVVVGTMAQASLMVEGAGAVVEELDRTPTITALYRDIVTVIPMGIHSLEALAAVAG